MFALTLTPSKRLSLTQSTMLASVLLSSLPPLLRRWVRKSCPNALLSALVLLVKPQPVLLLTSPNNVSNKRRQKLWVKKCRSLTQLVQPLLPPSALSLVVLKAAPLPTLQHRKRVSCVNTWTAANLLRLRLQLRHLQRLNKLSSTHCVTIWTPLYRSLYSAKVRRCWTLSVQKRLSLTPRLQQT